MSNLDKSATTQFEFGPYVPVIRTDDKIIIDPHGIVDYYCLSQQTGICRRLLGEILPDDLIVDAPSLVTPLLLKKRTIWPPKEVVRSSDRQQNCDQEPDGDSSDDIQVLKVISKDSASPDIIIDNNPRYKKVEDYIKSSVVANLTNGTRPTNNSPILAIQDYFKSSVGELLVSIGLSRVTEFITDESVKKISRKVRGGHAEFTSDLETLKAKLARTKKFNAPYRLDYSVKCSHCEFKTEFLMVLDDHLEAPHKNSSKYYMCNWCTYRSKDSGQISFHNHVAHKKFRCRIENPLSAHCCRYCPYESNSKRKFTSHLLKCEPAFQESSVQASDDPNEYPAITSKLITQQDVRTYESTLKALRLAAYNPHQIKVSSSVPGFGGQPILVLPKPSVNPVPPTSQSSRPQVPSVSDAAAPYSNITSVIGKGNTDKTSNSAPNQQQSSNLMRLLATQNSGNSILQNRGAVLQHPKAQSIFVNGLSVVKNAQNVVMAPPSQVPFRKPTTPAGKHITIDLAAEEDQLTSSEASCSGAKFVICEICDSYIENLSLFKSHMQWVHKVKIHQKLLETTRPPLNCQKCNYRFFTDQGLERHLLGSHGLVTTNMQELADNEKDSGRCTVCGIRCPRKLVSHMKEVHKSNLKPAQLSYKCLVCSATFSLYRVFENHVYRVHTNPSRHATDNLE